MLAIVVIPARYYSTRFPAKVIAPLCGKPLIQHVYESAKNSKLIKDIIIATDNKKVLEIVESFGGKAVMTSHKHSCGTDRVAEVIKNINCEVVVNLQADEPLIRGEMIDDVVDVLKDKKADIGTLAKKIEIPEEISDPNVVKVVFDKQNFALYFSRSIIPFCKGISTSIYKHIGIYSYRKDILLKLTQLPESKLEKAEKLEQLRALENGFKIKIKITKYETIGIDTKEDLDKVEKLLKLEQ